jgi:hypothetical protein
MKANVTGSLLCYWLTLSIRDRQKKVVAQFVPNSYNYLESDCTDGTNIISLIKALSKQMGYILFSHYLFVMEVKFSKLL